MSSFSTHNNKHSHSHHHNPKSSKSTSSQNTNNSTDLEEEEEEEEGYSNNRGNNSSSDEPILYASYADIDQDYEVGLMLQGGPIALTTSLNNNSNHPPPINTITTSSSTNNQVETIASISASILDNYSLNDSSEDVLDDLLNKPTMLFSTTTKEEEERQLKYSCDSLDSSSTTSSSRLLQKSSSQNPYQIAFQRSMLVSEKCASSKLPNLDFLKKTSDKMQMPNRPCTAPAKVFEKKKPVSMTNIQDLSSLQFLLPPEYKEMTEKEKLREKCDDEKEVDEKAVVNFRNSSSGGGGGVVMRRRHSSSYEKEKKVNRLKRFSLQELEDVSKISEEIASTLQILEEDFVLDNKISSTSSKKNSSAKKSSTTKKAPPPLVAKPHPLITTIHEKLGKILQSSRKHSIIYSSSTHAKQILTHLCPCLYNLFSDGLVDCIETLFGKVPNSVWRVVEASVAGAPTSQILSELVLRINSETDLMGEGGPLKFNAFVCGLLNLGSLPSYLSLILSQKERLLRTHYSPSAFLYNINTGHKSTFDSLVSSLSVLTSNYQLDIFYETKLMHKRLNGVKNNSSMNLMKRSASDEKFLKKNANESRMKGVPLPKSKTQHQIVEHQNRNFSALKMQWEMFEKEQRGGNSRIPRLISAPVSRAGSVKNVVVTSGNSGVSSGGSGRSNYYR